jgi:D-threonate/D-erythronate kinase
MKVRVITDDFTSASDGIAVFASLGWACAVAFSVHEAQALPVISCDTDSRILPAPRAAERAAHWGAAWRDSDVLIKQFDSTLRGPIAQEIKAIWQASGRTKLIIVPAFPDAGRTTQGGVVLVHGKPVAETAFANDLLNPVKQSDLRVILHDAGIAANVCLPDQITQTLRSNDAVIVDVQTETDLDAIAVTHVSNALWCGSTGLVRAFARTLKAPHRTSKSKQIALSSSRKTWICVGSRNPVSREQKAFLAGAPLSNITLIATDDSPGDPYGQALELASKVAHAVQSGECDSIVATGGETARHIAQALQAKRLHVLRELAPGIPLCSLELADRSLPFVTKAGGFGDARSLRDLAQALQKKPS